MEQKRKFYISNGYAISPAFETTYKDAIYRCIKSANCMCACWLFDDIGEIGKTKKIDYGYGQAFFANNGRVYEQDGDTVKCVRE